MVVEDCLPGDLDPPSAMQAIKAPEADEPPNRAQICSVPDFPVREDQKEDTRGWSTRNPVS